MTRLGSCLRRFLHEHRRYLFYSYDPAQGPGLPDPRIRVFVNWADIPAQFRRVAVPSPWMNVMYYRLRRGKARLLCLSEDGRQLDAYGWIQDWSVFRRRFGAVADRGTMLGFYWTAPARRGQGLYGRLLAHSLALCDKTRPVLIATSPDNVPSQRGIEKAGFRRRGEWEGRVFFRWFSRMDRVPGPAPEITHGLS